MTSYARPPHGLHIEMHISRRETGNGHTGKFPAGNWGREIREKISLFFAKIQIFLAIFRQNSENFGYFSAIFRIFGYFTQNAVITADAE